MNHLPVDHTLQNGKYRILRFINSGGFGCTYEGYFRDMDARVAIKEFFPSEFCNRDDLTNHVRINSLSKTEFIGVLKRKFLDEARAIFKLSHPGIVKVYDVFEENGTAYYVMEYINGESLDDMLRKYGPICESACLDIMRQTCDALKYLHSKNRLHLDIKPANIMRCADGRIVLIDFGASKQYDERNGQNNSAMLSLTPGYASLEQMSQNTSLFSPATDIYSLGATLYSLLTAATPPNATLLAAGDVCLQPLPRYISPQTCNALYFAMQLSMHNRPQNIAQWENALFMRQPMQQQRFQQQQRPFPPQQRPFPPQQRPFPPQQRPFQQMPPQQRPYPPQQMPFQQMPQQPPMQQQRPMPGQSGPQSSNIPWQQPQQMPDPSSNATQAIDPRQNSSGNIHYKK